METALLSILRRREGSPAGADCVGSAATLTAALGGTAMEFHYAFTEWDLRFGALDVKVRSAAPARPVFGAASGNPRPIGGQVWSSALALAAELVGGGRLDGTRTLELGCGAGLGSVVAALLGSSACASDLHPDMRELVAFNAQLNDVQIEYAPYAWDSAETPGQFDLVMGSDILYDAAHCALVLEALRRTMKPGGRALITDPGRQHLDRFEAMANDGGFRCERHLRTLDGVTHPSGDPELRLHPGSAGPFHLFMLTRFG